MEQRAIINELNTAAYILSGNPSADDVDNALSIVMNLSDKLTAENCADGAKTLSNHWHDAYSHAGMVNELSSDDGWALAGEAGDGQ